MVALFTRPLDSISREDVLQLVKEEHPEGDLLELKENLQTREGKPDPWMQGESSISDRARNAILEEVVAFANAHGGHVVLGVKESEDHPKRAAEIRPVPRCSELADRLRLQARDSIDPQLPVLGVVGVPTESDGAGVVVVRVGQSRLAPHRLQQTRECYIRRADRTEKMTMREIQDLTLQRERGMAALDATFMARRERWASALHEQAGRFKSDRCIGVRLTLLPTTASLWIDRVFRNGSLTPVRGAYNVQVGPQTHRVEAPGLGWSDRPILRGVRFSSENEQNFLLSWEIGNDGLVEGSFFYADARATPGAEGTIFREWILALLLDAFITVARVRAAGGAPEAEYGLELELRGAGVDPYLGPWAGSYSVSRGNLIEPQPLLLPRIAVGGSDGFAGVLRTLLRDLLNAAGLDLGDAPVALEPWISAGGLNPPQ